jgi:hypothetical protein
VSLSCVGISGGTPDETLTTASCGNRSGCGYFLVTISTITHLTVVSCSNCNQYEYPKDQTSLFVEYFRSVIHSGAIHLNGPVSLNVQSVSIHRLLNVCTSLWFLHQVSIVTFQSQLSSLVLVQSTIDFYKPSLCVLFLLHATTLSE